MSNENIFFTDKIAAVTAGLIVFKILAGGEALPNFLIKFAAMVGGFYAACYVVNNPGKVFDYVAGTSYFNEQLNDNNYYNHFTPEQETSGNDGY